MLPKLIGNTTRTMRPDLVERARRMALKMSPQDISQVQQGMADRADSVPTLKLINVPTQMVTKEKKTLWPRSPTPKRSRDPHLGLQPRHDSEGGTMPLTRRSPKKSACCCDNLSMPIAKPTLVVAKFQDKLPTYSALCRPSLMTPVNAVTINVSHHVTLRASSSLRCS